MNLMDDGERLTSIYQSLVLRELEKLENTTPPFNFNDERSYLTSEEINNLCGETTVSDLVLKGLLIQFSDDRYRTSHLDLIYRLVNIRNLEHQRPIPLEFKIVKKEELVPNFGHHKFSEVLPKIIPESQHKEFIVKTLITSLLRSKYQGLSSYQLAVVKELVSPSHKTAAIVAPTASGKSLTFFLPVLFKSILKSVEGKSGVSSILIYPRKALERDQLQTFLRLIDAANENLTSNGKHSITVGIDDGDTPRAKDVEDGLSFRKLKCVSCDGELVIQLKHGKGVVICKNCQKSYPYLLVSKDEIWKKPPSILVTNLWTVYRRLMSARTVKMFQSVDFVVVDEAHVYTHFLGGHAFYILKMLRYVVNQGDSRPIFIFSSATIPNPKEFVADLAGVNSEDLFYVDYNEALTKSRGKKLRRILLYLYLLPHPSSSVETLTEALILAITLWCHRNNTKGITFIDSISEISTIMDYIHTTILGKREGREVTDHILGTELSPSNDYCWATLAPRESYDSLSVFKEFVLTRFKESIEMHYGGLSLETRAKRENDFYRGFLKMLLSTSTLELGIDLSDVAVILQHKLPITPEGVVQRVGRSGRNPNCYRIALGVITLPTLPLSTLYMFNERLRGTLESVSLLPPLRIGEASHNLRLQYTLSLLLLKRALEGKKTFIDLDREGIRTEKSIVDSLKTLRLDLPDLPEFNDKVKLFPKEIVEYFTRRLMDLISPLLGGLERIGRKNYDADSEQINTMLSELDGKLGILNEAESTLVELGDALSRVDIFDSQIKERIQEVLLNARDINVMLKELRKSMRWAIETKEPRVIKNWVNENMDILVKKCESLITTDDTSEIARQLLTSIDKFDQFRKKYGIDSNQILKLLTKVGECFGTGEDGKLISFFNGLPENLKQVESVDFEVLGAFQSLKRTKEEINSLPPGSSLDLLETLTLMLEGRAHFSLLLTPPSPDLEMTGVEEV